MSLAHNATVQVAVNLLEQRPRYTGSCDLGLLLGRSCFGHRLSCRHPVFRVGIWSRVRDSECRSPFQPWPSPHWAGFFRFGQDSDPLIFDREAVEDRIVLGFLPYPSSFFRWWCVKSTARKRESLTQYSPILHSQPLLLGSASRPQRFRPNRGIRDKEKAVFRGLTTAARIRARDCPDVGGEAPCRASTPNSTHKSAASTEVFQPSVPAQRM